MIRRFSHFLAIASLFLALPRNAPAQSPASHAPSAKTKSASASKAFEPLSQWKAAVLAGNLPTLQAFYSATTRTRLPQGDSTDPNEEAVFWTGMHAGGLTALDPKVLLREARQPGQIVLLMRVYLTIQEKGESHDYVMSLTQLWAQEGSDWKIAATQRSNPAPRPSIRLPEPAVPNPDLYPDPSEAQKDLDSALAAATHDHKHVIVVFGANWCYDCHVLDAAFHSAAIAPIVKANYHVVHVNIGNYDQNLDIAERLQTPLKKGVPVLAVLDSKGQVLTSQKNGEFESAYKIGPTDITDFLNHWKPSAGK
jgi:ketosteroid isomerase-like protein